MVENIDIKRNEHSPSTAPRGADNEAIANTNPQHTRIIGRFNQYMSGFWAFAMPMLGARYFGRFGSKLLKLEESSHHIVKNSYGYFIAGVMFGVTTFYAERTARDMKHIFSEAVGWELNKKPEDVTFRDIAFSKNAIVHRTVKNFLKRNTFRYLTNLSFLGFLIPFISKRKMSIYDSVDLGVGATSAYLATDVISRKITFFEQLQNLIDLKINHTDRVGELITPTDLMSLYERHARDKFPNYGISGRMDSQEWRNDQELFTRIASLMNRTYGNEVAHEKADFTISKMIYMLGFGLIKSESLEKNLLYVEVANRYGVKEADKIEAALKGGAGVADMLKRYQVTLPLSEKAPETAVPAETRHADKIAGETRARLNAASQAALSHAERARIGNDNGVGASVVA